jgi:hypothetical protein
MAQAQADALALWFRRTAAGRTTGSGMISKPTHGERAATLLCAAADSAERLQPDDERLDRLAHAMRFSDFYGELQFVGGGSAVRNAKADSVGRDGATGQQVLEAVIVAALSEDAPGEAA